MCCLILACGPTERDIVLSLLEVLLTRGKLQLSVKHISTLKQSVEVSPTKNGV